ncbi:putative importin 9 [Lineolata rhizophorae]|uniref:Putative importin 9 n=1 Tax=Lineolata rhizophorae TaxID=578093 RepID=A0A6A6PAN5_9PEZI|nr:putative importin 9 [Lineolata rhizophorae]
MEEGFSDETFYGVVRDLVKTMYDVSVNADNKPTIRALAVSVFRGSLNTLETVMEERKAAVKQFADEALSVWIPFFIEVLESRLPPPPPEDEENQDGGASEIFRGLVVLKIQVVKVLMRMRSVFPSTLSPHSPALFSATWNELSALQEPYHLMYIEEERQSRLEDADHLPYTLDFLVLEELDFMQACLRASPVRKELEQQLSGHASAEGTWVTQVMKVAVAYAQITTEEEGVWNLDVNIFLSEETGVTANYTPRTACGDLVIKLGEWLEDYTVDGLLSYSRSLYSTGHSWKAKEAALYILNQLLGDLADMQRCIKPEAAEGFIEFIRYAMQQNDEFLRARGHLVAGSLIKASDGNLQAVAAQFMEASLRAITTDESEVVKVSCIRALQPYLPAAPANITMPLQPTIIAALAAFLSTQDVSDMAESDDLMVTLVNTLKSAILLNTQICIAPDEDTAMGPNGEPHAGAQGALNLLFTLASHGANNFQLTMLVNETFEDVARSIAASGYDAYVRLCEKVLPGLSGAFDVGALTDESALTSLAADLLSTLAEYGSEPLPQGFVAASMPKLNRLLLGSSDGQLLRAATVAAQNIIAHDHKQLFEWQDPETHKGGLEVMLVIIDRLLSPSVEDAAAANVGGLAAEVVEKAGRERLGPYLEQLLRAVAVRVGSATQAAFIQSLIFVFVRLSIVSPHEVVEFLAQVEMQGGESGLAVVMRKWLENSVNFAGYDEIRQNVIALSKLYDLQDPRLAQIQVKGDLIVPQSDRIMTRSRTLQNPDQYTVVSAQLKIMKVLVDELLSAAGGGPQGMAARSGLAAAQQMAAEEAAEEDEDDDDEWEDDLDTLDLGLGVTKRDLMSYDQPNSAFGRAPDDETQAYLVNFFREQSAKPGFGEMFAALSQTEQDKLRSMS